MLIVFREKQAINSKYSIFCVFFSFSRTFNHNQSNYSAANNTQVLIIDSAAEITLRWLEQSSYSVIFTHQSSFAAVISDLLILWLQTHLLWPDTACRRIKLKSALRTHALDVTYTSVKLRRFVVITLTSGAHEYHVTKTTYKPLLAASSPYTYMNNITG